MHTLTHPGQSLRVGCLEPNNLSMTNAAKILGVTCQALNNLVNGKSRMSPEMAIGVSKAFGGTPDICLRMQMAYDLALVQKKTDDISVRRFEPA